MCVCVYFEDRECDTVVEFRVALGLTRDELQLQKDDRYGELPSDICCLCGVDVEAALERCGWEYEVDDIGDYIVHRRAGAPAGGELNQESRGAGVGETT